MIVDSSAVIAIFFEEDGAGNFRNSLSNSVNRRMSVANYVEVWLRLIRLKKPEITKPFEAVWTALGIELVPISAIHADLAIEAFRRYGKGLHPAGLNFGDCFAYALAKERGEPLLFKGDDFAQTDIVSAI